MEEFELEIGDSVVINSHRITVLDIEGDDVTLHVEEVDPETLTDQIAPITLVRDSPLPR